MTLKDTPTIVTQAGVAGLEFTDEVKTANALVPVLQAQGRQGDRRAHPPGRHPVPAEVVGPDGKTYDVNATYDYTCGKGGSLTADSPILPIAARASTRPIDMVISGHTHQPYVCNVPDPKGQQRLVTSASSFGRLFTETDLTYDTPHRRHRARLGQGLPTWSSPATWPRTADETQLINTLQRRSSRRSPARCSARSPTDITRTPERRGRVAAR